MQHMHRLNVNVERLFHNSLYRERYLQADRSGFPRALQDALAFKQFPQHLGELVPRLTV